MEPKDRLAIARRLWHVVRAVCYMIGKGLNKSKLAKDFHIFSKRRKITGKFLRKFIVDHHHRTDPCFPSYGSQEFEFSCSNTPVYRSKKIARGSNHDEYRYVEAITKAFEMLNDMDVSPSPSLSPSPFWSFGKSPAVVRQLRITDSPFPLIEEEGEVDFRVDKEAEEFIKRFYEQLRSQQSMSVDRY